MTEQVLTDNKLCLKCQTGGSLVAKPEKASYVKFLDSLGSAVVVLDRADYLREGYSQLSDECFCQKVDTDLTEDARREVNRLVEDMYQNGEIHPTVEDYLMDVKCHTARLYFCPQNSQATETAPGKTSGVREWWSI